VPTVKAAIAVNMQGHYVHAMLGDETDLANGPCANHVVKFE
jgi:hypothetical protein